MRTRSYTAETLGRHIADTSLIGKLVHPSCYIHEYEIYFRAGSARARSLQ
jgi:hypothetical protein